MTSYCLKLLHKNNTRCESWICPCNGDAISNESQQQYYIFCTVGSMNSNDVTSLETKLSKTAGHFYCIAFNLRKCIRLPAVCIYLNIERQNVLLLQSLRNYVTFYQIVLITLFLLMLL